MHTYWGRNSLCSSHLDEAIYYDDVRVCERRKNNTQNFMFAYLQFAVYFLHVASAPFSSHIVFVVPVKNSLL